MDLGGESRRIEVGTALASGQGVDGFMKLDVLAFGALRMTSSCRWAELWPSWPIWVIGPGVADMTQGELGTRGTSRIRSREAQAAAEVWN